MRAALHLLAPLCLLLAVPLLTAGADERGCSVLSLEQCDLVDMSHPFDAATIYWPGAKTFGHEETFVGVNEEHGFYYSAYNYEAAEHGGTHVDAPVHFGEGKLPLEQVPVGQLIGEACVLDVRAAASANADYLVTRDDMETWERSFGSLDGCILLAYTGFEQRYPDKKTYLGSDDGTADDLHFPGFHWDAIKWLVENRKIKAVGLDTPSTDYGQSKEFKTHVILSAHNLPGLENVMNMGKLPARGATLVALPMKIAGGSGGPARIIAIGGETDETCRRPRFRPATDGGARCGGRWQVMGALLAAVVWARLG